MGEGEPLGLERELLAVFGVSRPTLREALRVLDAESLIDVRRGSREGARVRIPKLETTARYLGLVLEHRNGSVDDIFVAACALEAPCAGRLATKRSEADLEVLCAAIDAQHASLDHPDELLTLQNGFHRLIVELAGNETIGILVALLRELIDVATRTYLRQVAVDPALRDEASRRGMRAHRKLLGLIEARDAEGAERLWRRQILATGEHLSNAGVNVSVLDILV